MPTTNFPGSNDSFGVPSAPASTALNSAGDSARNMVNNHGDMGAAIMAMQAEATYLTHAHDGTARNGSKLVQANTHQSPDTDTATTALHHTIGTGANQGAAGNHTHTVTNVWPVGSVFIAAVSSTPTALGLPGTWSQITGVFIVASGSTFTGTGGTSSHTHGATFATSGGHSHSTSNVDSAGGHSHTNGGTGSSSYDHSHGNVDYNWADSGLFYFGGSGSYAMDAGSHTHASEPASNYSGTSHSHGVNSTDSQPDHAHAVPSMDTQGGHSHTSNITSANHLPPYLAVNVWQRTA